jgi:Domain of unknown function (DUF1844)
MTSSSEKAGESAKGFTVTDRRGQNTPAEDAPQTAPGPSGEAGKPGAEPPLPPVDFATFVLSLGSSALMHLGEVEQPGTGKLEKNLPLAKHSIDLLSMLEAKTKGNLTAPEAQLLENLLFDLRLRYVEALKK